MTEQINKIPARLKNMAKNGHVAGADDIIDDVLNKTQNQVNQDLLGADQIEKNRAESAELALRNAVGGLTQSKVVVGALPASGAASTIYRVPGTNSYSDYAWNGSQFVLMATYNNAIDNVPTEGSDNLVKSDGVYNVARNLDEYVTGLSEALTKNENAVPVEVGNINVTTGFNENNTSRIRTFGSIDCSDWTAAKTITAVYKYNTSQRTDAAYRFYDANGNYLGTTWTSSATSVRCIWNITSFIDVNKIFLVIGGTQIVSCDLYKKVSTEEFAKAIDTDVTRLRYEIYGVPTITIPDGVVIYDGHIDASGILQESAYKHVLIPVENLHGYKVSVKVITLYSDLQYALIRDIDGIQYFFVNGGSRVTGIPTNLTITDDAKYLYMMVSNNVGMVSPCNVLFTGDEKIITDTLSEKLDKDYLLEKVSKNLINPSSISFDRRYSANSKSIISADTNQIASSGIIKVTEGQWYVVSGGGIFAGYQGGYFGADATGEIGDIAIDNITFTVPVDENGRCFQVPLGQDIQYVIISLATNADHTELVGNAQMEIGEQATGYTPYSEQEQIKPSFIPNSGGGGDTPASEQDELYLYTSFGNLIYQGIGSKIPNFRRHFYAKDKDVCVVNTGTSLTARSSEHCTVLPSAAYRPPLMHSNNFATHIWDRLCWQGQVYRRYDSGFFTESGTGWQTQSNISDWDDGAYRDGLTRFTNDGGGVSFIVPVDAWQFNFIYRSDSAGSQSCVVSIAEGNNKMEVWNGTAWVEANGYTFSEREGSITTLPSVTYINPNTGTSSTLSNYQVKGNTTYQKRLKMRCKSASIDSRAITKSVNITSSTGRLLYWGVEWSPREFMITYINAARGSHNSLIDSSSSLLHFQDNEVWSFKPDLLLSEDPIHNSGASGVPSSSYIQEYFANVSEGFWFDDNGVSMKSRCEDLGNSEPEWALFNTSISWNFGGITNDGILKVGAIANGLMWSALEAQSSVYMSMLANHPEIIYINAVKNWVDACMACYKSMRAATEGSGKAGLTFTNEGSHWNNTGCKVMARVILPILDFFS